MRVPILFPSQGGGSVEMALWRGWFSEHPSRLRHTSRAVNVLERALGDAPFLAVPTAECPEVEIPLTTSMFKLRVLVLVSFLHLTFYFHC